MFKVSVWGINKALKRVNKKISDSERASYAALRAGADVIHRAADEHVPIDEGNLRRSWYTQRVPGLGHTLEIGYGANYAMFVHELPPSTKFKRKEATVKWFENAINQNEDEVVLIIKAFYRAMMTGK